MLIWLFQSVVIVLLGLGGVAFVTLLERKLLGLSQIRLGPNKTSIVGILQPVADGIKLLFKENFFILSSQSFVFLFSPVILLALFILLWTWVTPWSGNFTSFKYSSLFFFSLLALSAYAVILTGWSSSSSFSKLGSLRGMLQSLSFEVALMLLFMVMLSMMKTFLVKMEEMINLEICFLWMVLWSFLSLMETNRAPFDLLEGESELISGFNIEMSSLLFVYIFLSEYGMIIVLSLLSSIFFSGEVSEVSFFVFTLLLFARSCFPRIRYDILMLFMWQVLLPISIILFLYGWLLF